MGSAAVPRAHRPPRLTRSVASKLDRLARRAHAFHRFAHHPLCDRYAGEVIRLRGRTRVCRGCTYASAGALFGFAVGAVLPITAVFASVIAGISLAAAGMSVARNEARTTRRSSGSGRRSKLLTRAAPFAGIASALAWCVRVHDGHALALGIGILGLAFVLLQMYQRRGADRSPCLDCPERSRVVPCSGFRDIVRAERAFVRRSHALLDP
jgi:hypothetical protein